MEDGGVGRPSVSATARPPLVLDVTAEGARRSELPELVPDHAFGHEDRHVLATVVHGNGVTEHRRHDHGSARPGLDDVLGALLVLTVDLLHQVVIDERTLCHAPWHRSLLPLPTATTAAHDHLVARFVSAPGPALRLAPRADRVPPTG